MSIINYHTHTPLCKHASGTIDEYVQAAIDAHFSLLGFSDHTPWHYDSGYVPTMRMLDSQLPLYVAGVREAQQKYKDKITIKLGLEAEYFPNHIEWLKQQVIDYDMDYLIFGCHFYPSDEAGYSFFYDSGEDAVKAYVQAYKEGVESGLFSYVAHPDVFMRGYKKIDDLSIAAFKQICDIAIQHDIPLEYNLNGKAFDMAKGIQTYPNDVFWEIAGQYKVKALVGFDAHHVKNIHDWVPYYHEGNEKLLHFGCKIVEKISYQTWKL